MNKTVPRLRQDLSHIAGFATVVCKPLKRGPKNSGGRI